jgi:hypothetical protein
MLLYTHSPISGVAAKKNSGIINYAGNVSGLVVDLSTNLIGTQSKLVYINTGAASGLYTSSGINGGTLAQNDRDDAIIYGSQKTDLAGVANAAKLQSPIFGPTDMPHSVVSGSLVMYPSGWSYTTGQPIAAPVVTGETYGSADDAAAGVGEFITMQGNVNPVTGDYPTRN